MLFSFPMSPTHFEKLHQNLKLHFFSLKQKANIPRSLSTKDFRKSFESSSWARLPNLKKKIYILFVKWQVKWSTGSSDNKRGDTVSDFHQFYQSFYFSRILFCVSCFVSRFWIFSLFSRFIIFGKAVLLHRFAATAFADNGLVNGRRGKNLVFIVFTQELIANCGWIYNLNGRQIFCRLVFE